MKKIVEKILAGLKHLANPYFLFIFLAVILFAAVLPVLKLTTIHMEGVQMTCFNPDGTSSGPFPVILPHSGGSSNFKKYVFSGYMDYQGFLNAYVNIIPDDRVIQITVNNNNVPLDSIDSGSLKDYTRGFNINLKHYLNQGINSIEITVGDEGGGLYGLQFQPSNFGILSPLVLPLLLLGLIFVCLWIYRIVKNEAKVREWIISNNILIVFAAATIAAVAIRLSIINVMSTDINNFLSGWYDTIKSKGFSAYRHSFSDYTPFYLYILGIATLLPLQKVAAIKIFSILFDFVGAAVVYKIVNDQYPKNKIIPVLAYSLFLFWPTVILNSSYWGQCDIIFSTLCLASLYYFFKGNKKSDYLAYVMYALAFAIKLQAIFILPLFFIIWLKRNIPLKYFLAFPVIYLVFILPSLIAGRPLIDLLLIYAYQTNTYGDMTLGCPSLFQWFPNNGVLVMPAVILGSFIILAFSLLFLRVNQKRELNNPDIMQLTLILSLLIPFFLPRMHERYFYLADIMALLYIFYFPRQFWVGLTVAMISFFAYGPYLFGVEIIPQKYLSFGILFLILFLSRDCWTRIHTVKPSRLNVVNRRLKGLKREM